MPQAPYLSPVIPAASSRLWRLGAPLTAAVILILLAVLHRELAPQLLTGAALVGAVAWFTRPRTEAVSPSVLALSEVPPASIATTMPEPEILAAALDALIDPILIIRGGEADDMASRRILLANRAAREMFRIRSDGAALISAIRTPELLEAIDEALYGGMEAVVDYQSGDNQVRFFSVYARPLAPIGGAPAALLGLSDQTDSRRMEAMRVDFLANASHELKTPLASLAGFIETLKGHARDDAAARERFLDIMAQQADRMSRLVADLLSLSRIEMNEHIAPSGRVDLSRATTDVLDALALLASQREVSLSFSPPEGGADVRADRDQVLQVIQNLTDNALKYSPRGAAVEIEVSGPVRRDAIGRPRLTDAMRMPLLTPDGNHEAGYIAVTVRDHGPGMAREALPRLTERFYRVEGQKSGAHPGTGLGLAIVKHILNRHRGGLLVESAPGQGSVFTAYFPSALARGAEVETRSLA